jgi:hypothetical protein
MWRKRKATFDKTAVTIFAIIAITTIVLVLILDRIHSPAAVQIDAIASELSFRIDPADNPELPVSIIASAIRAENITVRNFNSIRLRPGSFRMEGKTEWISWDGFLSIHSLSVNSQISIHSSKPHLALCDFYMSPASQVYLSCSDGALEISAKAKEYSSAPGYEPFSLISVQNTISLAMNGCSIRNDNNKPIHLFPDAANVKIMCSMPEFSANIECSGKSGFLSVILDCSAEREAETSEIIKDLVIDEIDFWRRPKDPNKSTLLKGAIANGSVRYLKDNLEKSIEEGSSLLIKPNRLTLEKLQISQHNLSVTLIGKNVKKLYQVVKAGEGREMLPSYLDKVKAEPKLGVSYGVIMTLLGLAGVFRKR